jgi:FlaA1/EpsC-like NDP-sugar epimerase
MRVFITGISGTLGREVVRQLNERPENIEIHGLTRDEVKFKQMEKLGCHMVLGNIKDARLNYFNDMDLIFHFAALKHVDLGELWPWENVKTNINGTNLVLEAQREYQLPRVAFTSTDKAVYPINVYGNAKAVAERLVLENDNNVVCRYGNVLGSNGSVIHLFKKQLENDEAITMTDIRMTRFWITKKNAAKFVIANAFGDSGGLRVPVMKASTLFRLTEALARILGVRAFVQEVGLRPGEKLHEALKTEQEGGAVYSNTCEQYTDEELEEMIREII